MTQPKADPTYGAARASIRPLDPVKLGAYSLGLVTGVLPAALGAGSEIFQFRWAPQGANASAVAVIRELMISAAVSTTYFAAGVPVQIELVKCTAWTVQGTLGTGITMGATCKKKTSFAGSVAQNGDIRVATTAALGGGTKTADGNALATISAAGPASGPSQIVNPGTILWDADPSAGEHPLVLGPNEGFVVRVAGVPGTGTWTASLNIDWTEVAAY